MRRRVSFLLFGLCVLLGGMPLGDAVAQEKYPSRPIRIVVPFAPGSVTDTVGRILAEQMRQILTQSVIVENKPGALGIVAIEEMARSKPDGHILMIGNMSTNAITPILYPKKFAIDYEKDVTPVARIAITPTFFVVTTKDFPPRTFPDFLAHAKKNPGKVRYASTGVGHATHYYMEHLSARAGLQMVHIPIKQGSPGIARDLITGDVQATFLNTSTSIPQIKSGYIVPVGVMGQRRLPGYPEVPTMAEHGYPDVGTPLWATLFAPSATPNAILETLHQAVGKSLETAMMREALGKQMIQPAPTASLQETRDWIAAEMATWRRVTSEIKVDLSE